jgi:urea transport system permease protein
MWGLNPGNAVCGIWGSAFVLRKSVVAALSILVTSALLVFPGFARADELDSAFAKLFDNSFSQTALAIDEIGLAGSPNVVDILRAMADRRLFMSASSKLVFYRDELGKLRVAPQGEPASSEPSDLTTVRINNNLRGQIESVLSTLALVSPNPVRRLEAAQGILKSQDLSSLNAIERAIKHETDPSVMVAFTQVRGALTLVNPAATEKDKLAAVAILKERGDQSIVSVLRSLPAASPPVVKEAAAAAVKAVESRLALWNMAQNLWYGVSLSSVLLLAAVGLAITFGVMGVINMAHGEMVMIGAYTTFVVQELLRDRAPQLMDYSLLLAVPLAFLVAGSVGVAIERCVIRFLYGRPEETLLATWGISLILQQGVRTIFGSSNREVSAPAFMTGSFKIGELAFTWNRVWIVVFAGLIFAGLLVALRYTSFGLRMRAVTQNRRMASSMGIATGRVDALTFGLGSGIAGLAGVALSQIDNVSPNLGQGYIVDSFLVVVFGGVGNLWGTLVGALSIGMASKILEPYAGAVLGKIALIVLIIAFIQKRPRGLFALKGRAMES